MPTYRDNPPSDTDVTVYELACTTREPGRQPLLQTTTAGAAPAAAWLRALADEIDPPRRPSRRASPVATEDVQP